MSTVGAIADLIKTGLDTVDEYVDDPARRLKARLAIKTKGLEIGSKIIKEENPDEAAVMSAELRKLVMSF
jgi:hypothetical protein